MDLLAVADEVETPGELSPKSARSGISYNQSEHQSEKSKFQSHDKLNSARRKSAMI
jgi:hypothetical protein